MAAASNDRVSGSPTAQARARRAAGAPRLSSLRSSLGSGPVVPLWALVAWLVPVCVVASAGPVAASEVVDLRIGAHPEFTRVVFELDRPAGYRIERASPRAGQQELVVSLDATSIPRKVHSSQKSLIGLVRITPEGDGAVARIQLSQEGLSLKEMILANPPRIVLDVLSPARQQAAATKAEKKAPAEKPAAEKRAAEQAAAAAATRKKQQEKQAAERAAPKTSPKPAPADRLAKAETGAASADGAEAGPDAASTPARAGDEGDARARAAAEDGELAARAGAERAGEAAAPPIGEPSEGGVPTMGMEMAPAPGERPEPLSAAERVAKQRKAPELPPAPRRATADGGPGLGTIGLAGVALVVLAAAGLVVMRRRRAAAEGVDDAAFDEAASDGDNPFSGLARGSTPGAPLSGGAAPGAGGFDLGSLDDEEKEAAPVEASRSDGTDHGHDEADALIQSMAQDTGGVAAGLADDDEKEGDEEVMRIMREFERRIASLESRLDEVVDARERLERQVAAQTEELRVQRAAIARTQRAVRNLNRSEDEGPTEPALRDPQ